MGVLALDGKEFSHNLAPNVVGTARPLARRVDADMFHCIALEFSFRLFSYTSLLALLGGLFVWSAFLVFLFSSGTHREAYAAMWVRRWQQDPEPFGQAVPV